MHSLRAVTSSPLGTRVEGRCLWSPEGWALRWDSLGPGVPLDAGKGPLNPLGAKV